MTPTTQCEQIAAHLRNRPVTWDFVRSRLASLGQSMQEWAGVPMLAKGLSMTIHPSYPFAKRAAEIFMPADGMRICRNSDIDEQICLRNSWSSYRDAKLIQVWRDSRGFFFTWGPRVTQATMLFDSMRAADSWDPKCEERAVQTLRRHINRHQLDLYQTAGSFIETSKRSGVHYMFRKGRPTVAMSSKPHYLAKREREEDSVRILCTLCLHPIGYYNGTFAGALVPTDDLLAHLLLMRGDEHLFWKLSNQHHPLQPESGL